MKNKRWKVIVPAVLLVLALLYFTVIRKYMEWANVQALEDYAREQFASQDLEDYVRRCARAWAAMPTMIATMPSSIKEITCSPSSTSYSASLR